MYNITNFLKMICLSNVFIILKIVVLFIKIKSLEVLKLITSNNEKRNLKKDDNSCLFYTTCFS